MISHHYILLLIFSLTEENNSLFKTSTTDFFFKEVTKTLTQTPAEKISTSNYRRKSHYQISTLSICQQLEIKHLMLV